MKRMTAQNAPQPKKTRRNKCELEFKVVQGEEMSQEDLDVIVRILADMYLRDFQRNRTGRKPTLE
jgi:hypothetical protein